MTGNKMCKERGLKSNTIMKKPQCKNTLAKLVCQAFYG